MNKTKTNCTCVKFWLQATGAVIFANIGTISSGCNKGATNLLKGDRPPNFSLRKINIFFCSHTNIHIKNNKFKKKNLKKGFVVMVTAKKPLF